MAASATSSSFSSSSSSSSSTSSLSTHDFATAAKLRALSLLAFVRAHPEFGPRGLAACALTGGALCALMASGFWLAVFVPALTQFGAYTVFLTAFHLLEFVMTACFNQQTLTWDCTSVRCRRHSFARIRPALNI